MCFGACQEGPNIVLYPEKNWYAKVKVEDLDEITGHLAGGPHVQRLDTIDLFIERIHLPTSRYGCFLDHGRHPFPTRCRRGKRKLKRLSPVEVATRRSCKALRASPEELIKIVSDAGLRGRGGAGFPTGKKWQFTREAPEQPRYLVVNGGEDEPGSKKDRVLLENLPHLVLEGAILGAYAIGATKIYLYINAQYDAATQSINDAIAEAKDAGYLGKNILGSGFDLDIEVTAAPHNYVAGEDTAVIEVIEGKKAWPRQKPPFPVTVGLFGKPTLVNNVETLANVAPIVLRGADWYRKFGTTESSGTMIFSLNDDVNRPGSL